MKTTMVIDTMELGGIVLDSEPHTMRRVDASKYRLKMMQAEEGFPGAVILGGRKYYERKAVDGWIARRVYLNA